MWRKFTCRKRVFFYCPPAAKSWRWACDYVTFRPQFGAPKLLRPGADVSLSLPTYATAPQTLMGPGAAHRLHHPLRGLTLWLTCCYCIHAYFLPAFVQALYITLVMIRVCNRLYLGCLTTSDWVAADGMTGLSFRRLPALLCLYWEVC